MKQKIKNDVYKALLQEEIKELPDAAVRDIMNKVKLSERPKKRETTSIQLLYIFLILNLGFIISCMVFKVPLNSNTSAIAIAITLTPLMFLLFNKITSIKTYKL
ncbi:hypothetical protein [uncultured Aquimarina sp.]|uniref:hypothetical protein n=1 Tax=uncultured Aquimarina sp. TaxID=575652 RepID=UPI002617FA62|nr:hypothetical protein [uncultured Aquimarina sp.]